MIPWTVGLLKRGLKYHKGMRFGRLINMIFQVSHRELTVTIITYVSGFQPIAFSPTMSPQAPAVADARWLCWTASNNSLGPYLRVLEAVKASALPCMWHDVALFWPVNGSRPPHLPSSFFLPWLKTQRLDLQHPSCNNQGKTTRISDMLAPTSLGPWDRYLYVRKINSYLVKLLLIIYPMICVPTR